MNFEIIRIALMKPDESESAVLGRLFPRDRYSLRIVESLDEMRTLVEEESSPFDAVILPIHVANSSGAETVCASLRTSAEFALTPIIALGDQVTPSDLASMLEAGADLVLAYPRDPEPLYLQVLAQVRVQQRSAAARYRALESVGLQQSTVRVLNLMREGILLFDLNPALTFINSSAGRLLGIDWNTPQELVDRAITHLSPLLESHIAACAAAGSGEANALPLSVSKTAILRADNRRFQATIRIVSITGHESETVGYALSITDLTEFDSLSSMLMQGQRMRTLGLLSAAACTHLSHGKKGGRSPTSIFTELHDALPAKSSCTSALTLVLEYLDLVLSTSTAINLQASPEFVVNVKFDDLFQLIGLAILEANDFTTGGDILVGFTSTDPSTVLLRVTGQSSRSVPFASADDFTALLQGSFDLVEDPAKKLGAGWNAAQAIASRYGARLTRECPDQLSIAIEIALPVKKGTGTE